MSTLNEMISEILNAFSFNCFVCLQSPIPVYSLFSIYIRSTGSLDLGPGSWFGYVDATIFSLVFRDLIVCWMERLCRQFVLMGH